MNTRTLPFRAVTVPVASGSDPDVIEIDMEDAVNVYGDWPEIDTPCNDSPVGQCVFGDAISPSPCIYCGRPF